MPKEKITVERMPEGITAAKNLLRECRDLRPGDMLDTRYVPADAAGEKIEGSTIFSFGTTKDGMFEATEMKEEGGALVRVNSHTYMDLISRLKELGVRGFVPFAVPETATMPARAAVELGTDRVKRETRESSIHYIQNINEKLRDAGFPRVSADRFAETHLVERVRNLKPGVSKSSAERGITFVHESITS